MCDRAAADARSLTAAWVGTTGWSVTEFATTRVTCGTRPATRARAKLHDPWQWMTAPSSPAPVRSSTACTATGWSSTAPWSSVHRFQGKSTLARQLSSHTSNPASSRTSTTDRATGGRNMLARTPAPWTRSTGPRHGSRSPSMWMTCRGCPSPAVRGTSVSRRSAVTAMASDLLVLDGGGVEVPQGGGEPLHEAGPRPQRMRSTGLHRPEQADEARGADPQDAGADDLRRRLVGRLDVPGEDAHVERGGVAPHVEAGVVADDLEPRQRQRYAVAVFEFQPVAHPVGAVALLDEEVEGAAEDGEHAPERLALDPAGGGGGEVGVVEEPVDVGDLDRQVEGAAGPAMVRRSGGRIGFAQGHVAVHLFGERQPARLRVRGLGLGLGGRRRPGRRGQVERRGRFALPHVDGDPPGGGTAPLLDGPLRRPFGEGGDGQRRVGPDRAGHGRAVDDVEAGIGERLAPGVHHAFADVAAHGHPA